MSVVVTSLIAVKFALRSSDDLTSAAAAIACAFLVFTPGWGVQYLIYPLPFLLVARPILGALYAVLGGGYAIAVYVHFLLPGFPFSSLHAENLRGVIGVGGLVMWVFFLFSLFSLLLRRQIQRSS